MLRAGVRDITSGFGPAYIKRVTEAGEPPTELWDALAEKGYLGVDVPEEYGGEGSGCMSSPPWARRPPRPGARCS